MNSQRTTTLTILLICILIGAAAAALTGILSSGGPGPYEYKSIRGETLTIYGSGIYRHMTADVAIQGIAQDWITLFLAIPTALIGLLLFRRGSAAGHLLMSGSLGYLLLTYLFYLTMGMYNELFLLYAALLGCTFFAFLLSLLSFGDRELEILAKRPRTTKAVGIFLIINASLIALLWLGTVVPPLLDGSLYPEGLDHYTTLIVQGFDLGLMLPLGFVAGFMSVRGLPWGRLFAAVYVIFLAHLMVALTSKILFMAAAGINVIPVIFIMPALALIAWGFSLRLLSITRS